MLLLEVVLPLLYLKVFLVNLFKVVVGFLLLAQSQVLLADLLLDSELSELHVFQLDFSGNRGGLLLAAGVALAQVKQSIGI